MLCLKQRIHKVHTAQSIWKATFYFTVYEGWDSRTFTLACEGGFPSSTKPATSHSTFSLESMDGGNVCNIYMYICFSLPVSKITHLYISHIARFLNAFLTVVYFFTHCLQVVCRLGHSVCVCMNLYLVVVIVIFLIQRWTSRDTWNISNILNV